MHLFGRPSLDHEYIDEKLEGFEDEPLLDLQHELQAAVKYHDHAQTYGDHAFTKGTFSLGRASDEAAEAKTKNASKFKEIASSQLYESTVNQLANRHELDIEDGFVGWINLTEDEIEEINDSLNTIAKKDVSDNVRRIQRPEDKQISEAKETLQDYDIEGYFVGFEDLEREFTEHYTTGPSLGGKWS